MVRDDLNSKVFTTNEIANIVGLPLRKILSFIEREYIEPSVQEASGPGTKRLWDYNDLIRVATFTLMDGLVLPNALRAISRQMQNNRYVQPGMVGFISKVKGIENPNILQAPDPKNPFSALGDEVRKEWGPIQVIDFKMIHEWVRDRIK